MMEKFQLYSYIRKKCCSINASISLYVVLVMSFIIICMIGIFILINKNQLSQIKLENEIKKYYSDNAIYLYDNINDKIPVEDYNQLLLIGTDKNVLVSDKIYNYIDKDYSKYMLLNDIVINIEDINFDKISKFMDIDKNDYEILYYYDCNYYILKEYIEGNSFKNDNAYIFYDNKIINITKEKIEDNIKYLVFDILL